MKRLVNGAGRRCDDQRHQPPPSSQRTTRTPALSRPSLNLGSGPEPGHNPLHFSPERPLKMTNEKELLRGLNERFAGFIEKVHRLESHNRALEREIEDIRVKAKSSTSLAQQYEPELQDLRKQVREMTVQKHEVELEQKRVEDEFQVLQEKCEEEARSTAEAQDTISALKKYIDNAHIAKQDMQRKAKALEDEIKFLKRNHEAEVAEIWTQMKDVRVCAEVRGFGKGELTAALRDIRTQLEGRAFCPDMHPDQHFSKQLAKLTKAAETDREALIATKDEISQYRRQLQTKNMELDGVRGMREALEKQLYDLEQQHTAEIHHYQDTIRELEEELKKTRYDTSSHVQDYHDLLNVKMALDAEIYSYRKLLESEESRYSTVSDAQIPVPYVYRQSPIYTLPRLGGMTRKAEPQYKFVEEIITETTREDIEISDTGSDDAEGEREVCGEKENAGVAAGSETHLEEKKGQESEAEDNTGSPNAEQLDTKDKTTQNKEQYVKMSTGVSMDLKEGSMNTEIAENNFAASRQSEKKDTDDNYNKDDADSKSKEPVLDTTPEKPQAATSGEQDGEKEAHDTQTGKQELEKEIDQATITQSTPTEHTATQEVVTEPGKSGMEEISPKSENEKAKQQTPYGSEHEKSSAVKTKEQETETSRVKYAEADVPTPDPQPLSQTAEAGQETGPNSEADSKQSVDTSQADVLNSTKAASAQENAADMQKELAEKVEPEALLKSEAKEIKSEKEKTMDSKPEADTEAVKTEKQDSAQSTQAQITQEDISTDAAKEIKAEISERKENQTKDMMDRAKMEERTESKKTEKDTDQTQIKEQPNVAEAQSEEPSQMNDKTCDKENIATKPSEIQDIQKDTKPKPTEKETKYESKSEKQGSNEHELEISGEIIKMEIKPKEQDSVSETSTDVQLEEQPPEKEQTTDQTKMDKDSHKLKNTNIESLDKTGSSEGKQDSSKESMTECKDPEKDPTPLKDYKKPEEKGQVSEKGQHNGTRADLKKESKVPAVTENGVNI